MGGCERELYVCLTIFVSVFQCVVCMWSSVCVCGVVCVDRVLVCVM